MKVVLATLILLYSWQSYSKQVTVFKSNLTYKKGTPFEKPQFFRIPSVVTINSSRYIVAFAEERLGSNSDSGDINVVYKYSKNHGRTWSRMYRLCDLGTDTCGNPTAVVDQSTGMIHIFMNGNKGYKRQFRPKNNRERIGRGDRWVLYSRGQFNRGHLSFDRIRNVTRQLQPSNFTFDIVGPGTGIDIERGPHKGRLVIPALRRTIYSDNGGRTWRMSSVNPSRLGTETAIAELFDGALFRSDRMHG